MSGTVPVLQSVREGDAMSTNSYEPPPTNRNWGKIIALIVVVFGILLVLATAVYLSGAAHQIGAAQATTPSTPTGAKPTSTSRSDAVTLKHDCAEPHGTINSPRHDAIIDGDAVTVVKGRMTCVPRGYGLRLMDVATWIEGGRKVSHWYATVQGSPTEVQKDGTFEIIDSPIGGNNTTTTIGLIMIGGPKTCMDAIDQASPDGLASLPASCRPATPIQTVTAVRNGNSERL